MINKTKKARLLVSACLLGHEVRYDGGAKLSAPVKELASYCETIYFCPEVAGGLPIPRPPAEQDPQREGRVFAINGTEVTNQYQLGSRQLGELAALFSPDIIILADKSPACGVGLKYDGTFSGALISGNGVAAQTLIDAGWEVFSQDELARAAQTEAYSRMLREGMGNSEGLVSLLKSIRKAHSL